MATRIRPKAPTHLYIREWRRKKGLTQEALGDRLDVDKGTVSRWENSKRETDNGTLAAICEALGITVAQIHGPPPAEPVLPPPPELPPRGEPTEADRSLAAELAEFIARRRAS